MKRFIEKFPHGTNAVYKFGEYVIKLYTDNDMETEVYGMKRAAALSVPIPKLIASGVDRFPYMITEFLNATAMGDIEHKFSYEDKVTFGQKLRIITDKLNTPCDDFNPVDVIKNAKASVGWRDFPESFQKERLEYLDKLVVENKVYCHGDLNPDNIFVSENWDLYLIDFADATYAPAGYEQALVASQVFCFEKPYMLGYFGDYNAGDIADLCAAWLPVHDTGYNTLRANIGNEITSFKVMRERLYEYIYREYQQ